MAVLGVSSLAPALPLIARDLDLSPQAVGLLVTVFTVPGVILTPILGLLADRYGRRRILAPSLFLFAAAGSACTLAQDFGLLLFLRFLQGMGAAALGSLNVTLLGDLYAPPRRAAAMGYNASVLSVGTASYPALGGFLAQLGWRYPFLLSLLAIPVGLAVLFWLRNPEPKQAQTLREYLGGVWKSVARREVLGLFTVSAMTFILLYGSLLTYFPLHQDRIFGAPAALIGLVMSSASVATGLTSAWLGKLTRRFLPRDLILAAFGLYAVALVLIPALPAWGALFLPAVLFGVAMGLNIPSLQLLLAGLAPPERRGIFMSLNGMVLRLGQTLGPLIMGLAYGLGGLRWPFFGGAFLAVACWGLILGLVPGRKHE